MGKKNFLVTGGAGFIGSHLVKKIQEDYPEATLTVLDRFPNADRKNLRGFKGNVIKVDFSRSDFLPILSDLHPDVIFHMAALTDTRILDQEKMDRVNVEGFRHVLELAKKTGSVVVYASSAAVYGISSDPLVETSPMQPANPYGVSKMNMERLAERYAKQFPALKLIGLRYFNVYGPGEDHKRDYASMISQSIWKIRAGQTLRLFKFGEQKRDFIHIKDVAEITLRAIGALSSGVFNVGTGQATSFNDMIKIIDETLKTESKIEYIDNPYVFFQPHTQADIAKVKNQLNFSPRYDIVAGIQDYLLG